MGRARWLRKTTLVVAAPLALLACLERSDAQASNTYPAHREPGAAVVVPEPRMWLAGSRPTATARQALATLRGAAEEGLDPADYGTDALLLLAGRIDAGDTPSETELTAFDEALTTAMVRYLHDVHRGRIEPPAVGFRLDAPDDRQGVQALLRDAIAARQLPPLIQQLRPQLKQYDELRLALKRYRSIAAVPTPFPPLKASVHPGDRYTGVQRLRQQLVALGDLPADSAPADEDSYGGPIVEGVRRFQFRHGLEVDGVLGKATLAALQVPMAWRVRQIELALERLRWLPHLSGPRLIALNIPMFQVWGWDALPPNVPSFETDVIVGRARSTRTPVLAGQLQEVVFRPYWNVPRSILLNEILPALRRDPEYLSREAMELVQGQGDDAPVVEASPENLILLRQGRLRLRQRPGPRNALGAVKFVFPNDEHV